VNDEAHVHLYPRLLASDAGVAICPPDARLAVRTELGEAGSRAAIILRIGDVGGALPTVYHNWKANGESWERVTTLW
jgi:hypothetical protein